MPDETTHWELWYRDKFDREAPTTIDEHGIGIIGGLTALWRKTLHESVNEKGIRTFSLFTLVWAKGTPTTGSASIPLHPTESDPTLAKLRRWAFPPYAPGESLPDDSWKDACCTAPHQRNTAFLQILAEKHYALLQKSELLPTRKGDRGEEARQLLDLLAIIDDLKDIKSEGQPFPARPSAARAWWRRLVG